MQKKKAVYLSFWAASIVLLVLTLSSCGSSQKQSNTAAPGIKPATKKEVILATTTSTMDTGLLDVLLPLFEKKTNYVVKPHAVGTGQALAMGEQGNADALLVHAPEDEVKLVEKGIAINRRLVMHNDFIIVGPPEDPAQVKEAKTAAEAFKRIASKQTLFISRGDDSGTHKKEKSIWKIAGIKPSGKWYQEAGAGMGQTLNIASEKGAYTLTDRGTYLALKKTLRLAILLEGERSLLNIYHIMQVNPEKFPQLPINSEGAKALVDFFISPETQKMIGEFGKDKYGEPLFFPDAGKKEEELGR
ncbi:tungstate transport system substrate-binding protein [Thermanaeromonas toyohensis ToBE]|uniref:Tungstate transport system substrate-binding protein n=1 Tax=Thermanaeromonas toyohensis ToBE TaxID=698762 RepID=A0A1W1V7N5_9FIRM|nr:substrate-binding domain-containing protein [Thermanaeromonas toyohensis]SMB89378.1 tungstate transport system substrate-binding protein [Thermanaeromonas toyohensis ToBE]